MAISFIRALEKLTGRRSTTPQTHASFTGQRDDDDLAKLAAASRRLTRTDPEFVPGKPTGPILMHNMMPDPPGQMVIHPKAPDLKGNPWARATRAVRHTTHDDDEK